MLFIFNEDCTYILKETKSEAISDLNDRAAKRKSKYPDLRYIEGRKLYFKKRPSGYTYKELNDKKNELESPMKNAQDYKNREDFFSTSNRLKDKDKKNNAKRRRTAKRLIVGGQLRKKYRAKDIRYRRLKKESKENSDIGMLAGEEERENGKQMYNREGKFRARNDTLVRTIIDKLKDIKGKLEKKRKKSNK